MDLDKVMYIFGSFSRRRQTDEPSAAKRRSIQETTALSAGNSPIHLSPGKVSLQSSSVARALSIVDRISSTSSADDKFRCFLCKQAYIEPRVLPCLHTFCTRCLQNIGKTDGVTCNNGTLIENKVTRSGSESQSGSGSAASGYESEQCATTDSDESFDFNFQKNSKKPISNRSVVFTIIVSGKNVNILVCPICGNENKLPKAGILSLPLNFVAQHRMVVNSLNRNKSRILCDLCSSDASASSRCLTCLASLCQFCEDAHLRQRSTCHHVVVPLTNGEAAVAITSLRRQAMCTIHTENELKIFCTTCSQVICRDCCLISHTGHTFESISKAVDLYTKMIRDSIERTKPVTSNTSKAIEKINNIGKRIQNKTAIVSDEVEEFIDTYTKLIEEHGKILQLQLLKASEIKLQALRQQTAELEKRAVNASDAVQFAEEILAEGSDVEVLSFVSPLLRRLEWCSCLDTAIEPRVSETIELLRNEKSSQSDDGVVIYGIISSQSVAAHLSILNNEGLRCIRVNKKNEILLEIRDIENQPLCHGGENVTGYYRFCDTPNRAIPLQVEDRQNGTYNISFTPEKAGNIQVAVLINGKPIKDSPFSAIARNLRPHHGKYHCCTFCSTGGTKDVECGCGSTMGGGYKGCGHGHEGHPGSRHWSCCGNVLFQSECARANSTVYQFSL